MGLTSGPFIALAAVLAVVVVLVAVRAMGRFGGRGPRDLAVRAGLVVATQLAVLFALLVAVNSWGEFYASWGELAGGEHTRATVDSRHRAPGPTLRPLAVAGPRGTGAGGARIDPVTVIGPRSGLRSTVYVVLPAHYDPGRTLPAVLVLGADPRRLAAVIDPAVFPAVYVVANPAPAGCVDSPGGRQAETFLSQDVPADVAAGYRTAETWGVVGDAADGYCAAELVLRRGDRFPAGASAGTSYATPPGDLYGGSAELYKEDSLLWRLENREPQPPADLLLAPVADARALSAVAQDPLHIELAPEGTALPASLPVFQRWLAAKLNAASSPDPAGAATAATPRPGPLPARGGGFKGHR